MEDSREMTVMEHLNELRRRLIWILVVFVICLIIGFFCAGPVIKYVQNNPITDAVSLDYLASFSPSDALRVYMQFAFLISLVITFPFALYQIWKFVSPGLHKQERQAALRFIPVAFLLFLVGLGFGYLIVFPMVINFMTIINEQMGTQQIYGIAQYFGFMFNIVIPFGILFEMPIVVMFLTRLRIVNPKRLAKMRRVAYFILAVIAITLTPPEIVSDILVTIPLLLLYEISVWISKVVYRRQLLEDEERERELAEQGEQLDRGAT